MCRLLDIGCHVQRAIAPWWPLIWIAGGTLVLAAIAIVLYRAYRLGGWPAVCGVLVGLAGIGGYLLRAWQGRQKPSGPYIWTREDKKRFQRALAERGLYSGVIDGIFGERTQAGVITIQKRMGKTPTGIPDAQIAAALGVKIGP